MNTYLLTWNPDNWQWTTLPTDAERTQTGVPFNEPWSCGNTKKIAKGDRLFLLKQGAKPPKGIIASGIATSYVYSSKHWDEQKALEGKSALYVNAAWDTVLNFNVEPLLQVQQIDSEGLPQLNWNTMSSGISIPYELASRMERLWHRHVEEFRSVAHSVLLATAFESVLTEEGYFEQPGVRDNRDRKLREIVQRRGQPAFRNKLIEAYEGRCAVTGSDAVDALEGAHLLPYNGQDSNCVTNGLLLRADIHTLFDLNLIGIEPHSLSTALSRSLLGTCLREFDGKPVFLPTSGKQRPSALALGWRWRQFQSTNP